MNQTTRNRQSSMLKQLKGDLVATRVQCTALETLLASDETDHFPAEELSLMAREVQRLNELSEMRGKRVELLAERLLSTPEASGALPG